MKSIKASPEELVPFIWKYNEQELVTRLENLIESAVKDSSGHAGNDYGATLIRLGRFGEAISFLNKMQKKHPGNAQIISNLGTAHDYAGNLDSAIYWLEKIPESDVFLQQENLHLALLKARQKKSSASAWLVSNPPFGRDASSFRKTSKSSQSWFRNRLLFQMTEDLIRDQVAFYPAPETGIAYFLWQLGVVAGIEYSEQKAYVLFKLAELYAGNDILVSEGVKHSLSLLSISTEKKPDLNPYLPSANSNDKGDSPASQVPKNTKTIHVRDLETSKIWWVIAGLVVLGIIILLLSVHARWKRRYDN